MTLSVCLDVILEEMEEASKEPDSRLSWLADSLRKPLVTGYSDVYLQRALQAVQFYCACVFPLFFLSF